MYRESEGLDEIKRAINFPKLEMPPADFLQNMEDYAKQAPRQFDDSGPKKVRSFAAVLSQSELLCQEKSYTCCSHGAACDT